jgi:ubiquinone/menaquinone biosynthesis C-methylase UbiE
MSAAIAFDRLAPRYDALWTNSVVGLQQRSAVWREIDKLFSPGDCILDAGCGTGQDAEHLAKRGVRVHAIDIAPGMIDATRRRVEAQGLWDHITTQVLSLEHLGRLNPANPFDGGLANFGVLSCMEDLAPVAASLARLVRPGGRVALCSMSRFCFWEVIWFLLGANPANALRRFREGGTPTSMGFPVFYPTAAQVNQAFAPYFRLTGKRGIGIFVPPSYVKAGPGLAGLLAALDRIVGTWPLARSMGDHQLLTFVRRESAVRASQYQRKAAAEFLERPATEKSAGLKQADRHGVSSARQAALLPGRAVLPKLRCPACGQASSGQTARESIPCPNCGFVLRNEDGIVRAILPARRKLYDRFMQEYSAIRKAEGRCSEKAAYYLALPYRDLSGRNSAQWAMRAKTFRHFVRHLLAREPQDILDLGAGNGWMSYRLAKQGHRPVAVDVRTDAQDGLGAAAHYFQRGLSFPRFEAEFDKLPFCAGQFDVVIFNASLHYSTDYRRTLQEAQRCLRPDGRVVVLDSPVYKRREHGERMREERHQQFAAQYGFRSDSIPSIEFLDEPLLRSLSRDLGLKWKIYRPWYGWQWHLRPWKARLLGRRPPSRFWILVGSTSAGGSSAFRTSDSSGGRRNPAGESTLTNA